FERRRRHQDGPSHHGVYRRRAVSLRPLPPRRDYLPAAETTGRRRGARDGLRPAERMAACVFRRYSGRRGHGLFGRRRVLLEFLVLRMFVVSRVGLVRRTT